MPSLHKRKNREEDDQAGEWSEYHAFQKRVRITPMEANNQGDSDVLIVLRRYSHYAFIRDVEIETWRKQIVRWHLSLECISTTWFDAFEGRNFPGFAGIAQEADMFCTDVVLSVQALKHFAALVNRGDRKQAHLHVGNWIEADFADSSEPQPKNSILVDIYIAAGQDVTPATIGTTPNESWRYLKDVRRIVPPRKRIELLDFYKD